MNIDIKPSDENEARVDFTGYIFITRDTQSAFERELAALVDQYAI